MYNIVHRRSLGKIIMMGSIFKGVNYSSAAGMQHLTANKFSGGEFFFGKIFPWGDFLSSQDRRSPERFKYVQYNGK